MTGKSHGARPPTGCETGTTGTTPATSWPAAWKPKPTRSGCSPPTSPSPGPTTHPNRQSKDPNGTRPSPDTGTPWPPSAPTAASAPTWSAAAATTSRRSTPSTPPSPANHGYRYPSALNPPEWTPSDRCHVPGSGERARAIAAPDERLLLATREVLLLS